MAARPQRPSSSVALDVSEGANALLQSIAAADRGETISAADLLKRLRR